MRGPGRSLSEEERAQIIRLWENGRTRQEIARLMRVKTTTVTRWILRAENGETLTDRPKPTPQRPPRQTAEYIERQVCELRKRGVRTGEIVRRTGVSDDTVRRILRREGLWLLQS